MQNVIVKTKDNPVVLTFSGVDLTNATEIEINLGSDTWTLSGDSDRVKVDSATQLTLELGNTTNTNKYQYLTITITDSTYTNGYTVTSPRQANLDPVKII